MKLTLENLQDFRVKNNKWYKYRYYKLKLCSVCNRWYLKRVDSKTNYCSTSCSNISVFSGHTPWNKGKTGIYLEETLKKMSESNKGNTFWKGKTHSKETKDKIAKTLKGRYIGEKHSNWNPNLTNEERIRRRHKPEDKVWRDAVKLRDNFTCQCCGKRGGELRSHHIYSFHSHIELRHDIENGTTLCHEHHLAFHKEFGFKNNTKQQLYYWLLENKED